MRKIAIFPGTFDPFTLGHFDLVQRGLGMFDEIIIALGVNAGKQHMFSLERRKHWITQVFEHEPRVHVQSYEGLTTRFAEQVGAQFILRGLRNSQDFIYESQIAQVNADMASGIQSVFIMSHSSHTMISSTVIRDLIQLGGNYEKYIPSLIAQDIPS